MHGFTVRPNGRGVIGSLGDKPGLRMADGGAWESIKAAIGIKSTPKEDAPKQPEAKDQPPPPPPKTAIGQYSAGTALDKRMKAAGLRDGGTLKTGRGGEVPGIGKGDKIPAKYEPGEFVVSNAMLEDNPGLAEILHEMREVSLAKQGKTVEEANLGAIKKLGIRAEDGYYEEAPKPPAMSYGDQMRNVAGVFPTILKTVVSAPGYGFNKPEQAAPKAPAPEAKKPPVANPESESSVKANPSPTEVATTPTPTQNANDVVRFGNSYTGPDNIKGDITVSGGAPRGGVSVLPGMSQGQIDSTLNNPNGSRWSANDNAIMAANMRDGVDPYLGTSRGGQGGMSVIGDGGGYGLLSKEHAEQRKMDSMMSAANKQSRTMRGQTLGFISQQAEKAATLRGQDVAAATSAARDNVNMAIADKEIENKRLISGLNAGLESRKIGIEETSAGYKNRSAQAIEEAQKAVMSAKTPEEMMAANKRLQALSGREQPNKFITVGGGQEWDEKAMAMRNVPQRVFNTETGQEVAVGQKAPALPPGMKRQIGTSNGKPVYEDENGKKFTGN